MNKTVTKVKVTSIPKNEAEAMSKLGGLETSTKTFIYLSPEELKNDIHPNESNRLDSNDHNHIRRLRKSMREKGFVKEKAIVVGSDLIIKAGHHRYQAALEEGIGAWVQIEDNYDLKAHSQVDNIQKPWSSLSWIRYYAKGGEGDFPKILEFVEKYGFGVKVCMMILSDKASESSNDEFDRIQDGTFKVVDWERAIWKAERILDFAPYFPDPKNYKNTYFAAAVLKCLKTAGYSHDSMIAKVKMQTQKLRLQRTRHDNLEMLNDIYNYKRHKNDILILKDLS